MAIKTIKMLDSGPNRNRMPGSIIEVDEARAEALVNGEHAEYCDQTVEAPDKPTKPAATKRRKAGK